MVAFLGVRERGIFMVLGLWGIFRLIFAEAIVIVVAYIFKKILYLNGVRKNKVVKNEYGIYQKAVLFRKFCSCIILHVICIPMFLNNNYIVFAIAFIIAVFSSINCWKTFDAALAKKFAED